MTHEINRQPIPSGFIMRSYDKFGEADRRTIRRWYAIIGVAYCAAILLLAGVETIKRSGPQWETMTAQAADR